MERRAHSAHYGTCEQDNEFKKWPVSNKARLYERVKLIRKILKILKDNEFINYNDKTFEQGKMID